MFGFLGNYFGQKEANSSNEKMAARTNRFNAKEAQKNRTWQETMSNSAYQRSMADMEKAGLNPMLAYMQGGASTPSGSQASGVSATMENEMEGAVSTALHAKRLKQEIKNMQADVKVKDQTAKTASAHEGKLKKETEAIGKSMGKNEAIGKAGDMISQGLQTTTNSAAKMGKASGEKVRDMRETFETHSAVHNAKRNYHQSQAGRDARRHKHKNFKKSKKSTSQLLRR